MDGGQAANILGSILPPSEAAQAAQAGQAKRAQADLLSLALLQALNMQASG
jgi:hypothetical protein